MATRSLATGQPHFCASCGKFGASMSITRSGLLFFCSKECLQRRHRRAHGATMIGGLHPICEVESPRPRTSTSSCELCCLGRGGTRLEVSSAEDTSSIVSTCACGNLVGFWV
ncbi:hypothetical protein H310_07740 [Aphanomyces invadans]|uniref:Uncharacterized protein n=1 Tax=Aphanomyces invadans TaxID=157072 RepID=A0A024U0B7_9STRA|nr:hypothetical protein H310_07740 [Aphanomyces invadans]ETV99674.1 hypothetical protein H310_07740 [Aphanomyces invadans]|eukprot:XP_008871450.1 hypothetical protein H310_07740 [Aphanomyces invadans]